jgi:hypothetical protein
MFGPPSPINGENESTPPFATSRLITGDPEKPNCRATPSASHTVGNSLDFAHCFLQLANLPNFAFSRYEATLWRQAAQTLFALDHLNGRKRGHRLGITSPQNPVTTLKRPQQQYVGFRAAARSEWPEELEFTAHRKDVKLFRRMV